MTTLATWADTMAEHQMIAHMDLDERRYRATLTPEQLLGYRRHNGELIDCPDCGPDREPVVEEFPDMVGTTTVVSCGRCGIVIENTNDALEYRDGKVVDVR